MIPQPEVQQVDREAAADLIAAKPMVDNVDIIRLAGADDSGFVQAFARHRAAAHEAGRAEGVREAADSSWDIAQRFLRTIEASPFWEDRTVVCVREALEPIRALSKEPTK